MAEVIGGIAQLLMLAFIIVFLSGEVSPRHRNWKSVLLAALGIVAFLFLVVPLFLGILG